MSFVKILASSHREIRNPTWDRVCQAVRALADSEKGMRVADEDGQRFIVVYYIKPLGFYVGGIGLGDSDYFYLCDGEDNAVKEVWLAGEPVERPRKAFVSEETVLKALSHFFQTGLRDGELQWELEKI